MQRKVNKWLILMTSATLGVVAPVATTTVQLAVQAATVASNNQSSDPAASAAITRVTGLTATALDGENVSGISNVQSSKSSSEAAANSTSSSSTSSVSAGTAGSATSEATPAGQASKDALTKADTLTSAQNGTVGSVAWTLDTDGVLTLSSGDLGTLGATASPWTDYATDITSIVIDGTITNTTGSSYAFLFANMGVLTTITGLEKLQMQNVTSMESMFQNDYKLTAVDFGQTDFNAVTSIRFLFSQCKALTTLDLHGFQADQAIDAWGVFFACTSLKKLDVSNMSINSATSLYQWCNSLTSLTTVTMVGFQANSATSVASMFSGCTQLRQLDMSGIQLKSVTTMDAMLAGCTYLPTLDMTNARLDSVSEMTRVFLNCIGLTSVITTGWTANNITSINQMFYNCDHLTTLDLSNWDTTKVQGFFRTFGGCALLETIKFKNTKFVTDSATDMRYMFQGCSALTTIDTSEWDVSNVTSMVRIFDDCTQLSTLDVSHWDPSKVESLSYTFNNCQSLTTLDVSDWHADSLTDLDHAFYKCSSLTTLSPANFDTSKVTKIQFVFANMSNLVTLDLTGWDLSWLPSAFMGQYYNNSVFANDTKLQHLALGPKFTFVKSSWMLLAEPSKVSPYTGKWKHASTGTTYTSADLMTTYDGSTMAGQYDWEEQSTVTVKYLDGEGNEIAPSETLTGLSGDDYTASSKTIPGYTLKTTPDNATGQYTADPITVTYVYDGNLFFNSAPTTIDFGSHELASTDVTYPATIDSPLAVQNNGLIGSKWQLTAELGDDGFTGVVSGKALAAQLYYQDGDVQKTLMPGVSSVIHTQTTADHNSVNLSGNWSQTAGLLLKVPTGAATVDNYQATISWSLSDAVTNN